MEDDSCRRAGSVPFKWEVCPGTPKHTRSASAAAAAPSAKVSPANNKLTLTLTPPPSMAASYSYCSSPVPYYHHSSSPRVVSSARSASVSPSRRRPYAYGDHRRAPTAFIDATPRAAAAATEYPGGGAPEADMAATFGCFSLLMLRRKGSKKGGGGSRSRSSSGSSSSGSSAGSFRSDGELGRRMRRSVSISSASSLPLPPGRSRYAEARAEVDAATGRGWFF